MKISVQTSIDVLSKSVTSLVDSIDRTWTIALPFLDELEDLGQSVWLLTLTIATITLIISLILMAALSYVCCLVENRSSTTLIVGVTSISMGSIFLALFTVSTMLLGGHGEVFLCRSLYDSPDYTILGKLLDRPGVLLHPNASSNGLIGDLLRPNGYYGGNASLTSAIQKCERNGATYDVFQLDALMNLSKVVDVREYPQLINVVEVCFSAKISYGSVICFYNLEHFCTARSFRIFDEITARNDGRYVHEYTNRATKTSNGAVTTGTGTRFVYFH